MLCSLCPRKCAALRTEDRGEGYCHCGTLPIVARAAAHFWEEPCISGTKGSGTVFFGGCSLGCVFCQNEQISHTPKGRTLTPLALAKLFQRMEESGVHNLNLVTATHFAPAVMEALSLHRMSIPVVWNSSGYESPELIRALADHVDIFLPDFKYASAQTAASLANAPDYPEVALKVIRTMCEISGPPVYDEQGMMQRGTLVRHLILPLRSGESISILHTIAEKLPQGTPVSLMRQYTPIVQTGLPGLDRRITAREYRRVAEVMMNLDLPGYIQEKEAAVSAYTPDFCTEDGYALLEGLQS